MTDHIFPKSLALKAFQSGPYRNEVYAIAELIDNSADAKATFIAVALVVDGGARPTEIAVLDNGSGMDQGLLRRCIQYGYGTVGAEGEDKSIKRKRRTSRLGKFGVGLVASSFSQCTDLQVMSWQNGEAESGRALATRLRLSPEASDFKNTLPDPVDEEVPKWAHAAFEGMPEPISKMESGTLVVWRDVSTTYRRKANTLQRNICELCGRIHREFIKSGQLSIIVNVFDKASGTMVEPTMRAQPVDPTFLTNWEHDALKGNGFAGDETLFTPYTGHPGDEGKNVDGEYEPHWGEVKGPDGGVIGNYILTASYRKARVVEDQRLSKNHRDPGQAPYGKLANQLRGVSLMRSGREIALDPTWLRGDRTVDRWVSVSIDFDHYLDDVFGVSNDKQQVRGLAELASTPIKEIKERLAELRNEGDLAEDWKDIRCLEVALGIKERLQHMQRIVSDQSRGRRTSTGGVDDPPNDPYTAPVDELTQSGNALSQKGRKIPLDSTNPSSDPKGTAAAYGDTLAGGKAAKDVRPPLVMENELKLDYSLDPYGPQSTMFSIGYGPGTLVVKFHKRHPLSHAMAQLLTPLEFDEHEGEPPNPTHALRIVRDLVASFARVLAEADHLNSDEALQLNRCLGLWSASAAHIWDSESE